MSLIWAMERVPYISLGSPDALGSIRDRRLNCLSHILNIAIDHGDLLPEDAFAVYQEVIDTGHVDLTPLPSDCDPTDAWLGMRDPCQDLNLNPK